jgi:lectin, mannose-binding 2
VVRRVTLPRNNYFGLSAATGDLADNHDVVALRVSDPSEMTAEEQADLAQRIEIDVDADVESEGELCACDRQCFV